MPWQEKGANDQRNSTPISADEELAIAVAAGDGRGHDLCDAPAVRAHEGGNLVADRRVHERITHDAFFPMTSADFELRLDQRQKMRRRSRKCEYRRQDELERDEARIDDDEVGPLGEPRRVEDANIGRFDRYDLCSLPQGWMQLAPSHIHGIDPPRTACQVLPMHAQSMIPAINSPLYSRPTIVPHSGMPRMKERVPSIGSMIQR